MDDLVQWLRAQLDEDERTALTWPADQRSWDEYGDRRIDYASGVGEEVSAVNVKATAALGWERIYVKRDGIGLSRHIARHDPTRVLREIDAKRRTLERHSPHSSGSSSRPIHCERSHPGVPVCNHDGRRWPCPDVLDLTAGYTDRPGYREEWRP